MEFMQQGTIYIFPKPDFDIKSIEHAWNFIGREIHEYTYRHTAELKPTISCRNVDNTNKAEFVDTTMRGNRRRLQKRWVKNCDCIHF